MRTARLAIGIGTAALAIGVVGFGAAGPASAGAAAGYEDCYSGAFCLFGDDNGTGGVWHDSDPEYGEDNRQTLVRNGLNDWAMSLANHTGAYFCIYSDANYQGHWLKFPPGREGNLNMISPAGHNWSKKTSSYRMVGKYEAC